MSYDEDEDFGGGFKMYDDDDDVFGDDIMQNPDDEYDLEDENPEHDG